MPGLIWIQAVLLSDVIPKRIFGKSNVEIYLQMTKSYEYYPACKELNSMKIEQQIMTAPEFTLGEKSAFSEKFCPCISCKFFSP